MWSFFIFKQKTAYEMRISDWSSDVCSSDLTWMTGHPDQNPVSPYCVGDSNAGLHAVAGLLVALEHRRRTGEGALVEAAMVDAALKDRKSTRLNSRQSCAPRQPSSD